MKVPIVSVIIPTHNRARLVSEAIQSVLRQTLQDFEIIVVDDGSTDETGQVVQDLQDPRIRYCYRKEKGVSAARNFGIMKSKGQYIALLDDDDLYLPKYLETVVTLLQANPDYGMAYSNFANQFPDDRKTTGFSEDRVLSGDLAKHFYDRTPYILPSATIMRTEVLVNLYFDEVLTMYEDVDFFLRLSVRTKFLCVPQPLVIRRIMGSNLSRQAVETFSPNVILLFERFYKSPFVDGRVPRRLAHKKISREYRGLARQYAKSGYRTAALKLIRKAIAYCPSDWHYYREYGKYFLLPKTRDPQPDWQLPAPLPTEVTVSAAL